jgi:MYXO-CTERM domain-containing protein
MAAGARQSTLTVVEATPRGPGIPGDVARMLVSRQLTAFRACHQSAMTRGRPLPDAIDVDLRVDGSGLVTGSPTVTGGDPDLSACMLGALRPLRFPPPEGGATTPLHLRLALNSEAPSPWQAQMRMQQFVLTRLHARYSREALGEDLVLRPANAIVGGREHVVGADGKLEEGARPDSANNFQARYAIRHPWTGPIACANPRRNVWGGPPGGSTPNPGVRPATDLAFAPRGQARLETMVKQDVPEIGLTLTAAAATQPGANSPLIGVPGPSTSANPTGASSGCGCDVVDPAPPTALLVLLFAAGLFALIAAVRRGRR